ncbi:MAG TPA: prolipoprotein diacylglyceryl transferase [Caldilinea sp.]|nr:prolipoprotein diacylglyceryl transferase [Caldilinea sp.]
MLPTVTLIDVKVSTYTLCLVTALFVGGAVAYFRLLRLGKPIGILRLGIALTIGASLLAMVAVNYVVNSVLASESIATGAIFQPEGMSILWALLGGCAAAMLICRWQQVPTLRVFDLFIVGVPLAQAIGRLGCWAAGCCYGRETEGWLGIYAPDDHGHWAERYPTQLISAAANLAIFFILLTVERRSVRADGTRQPWAFDGMLLFLYILLFAAKRFLIALLRESGAPLLGSFNWMQLSALLAMAITSGLWAYASRRQQAAAAIG